MNFQSSTKSQSKLTAELINLGERQELYHSLIREGAVYDLNSNFPKAKGKYKAAINVMPSFQPAWNALFALYKNEMVKPKPFLPKKILEAELSVLEGIAFKAGADFSTLSNEVINVSVDSSAYIFN